jgi:hypothetical protein
VPSIARQSGNAYRLVIQRFVRQEKIGHRLVREMRRLTVSYSAQPLVSGRGFAQMESEPLLRVQKAIGECAKASPPMALLCPPENHADWLAP